MRSFQSPLLAAAITALSGMAPVVAQPAPSPVGTLECNVSPSSGMIVTSTKTLSCVFHSTRGRPEFYSGQLSNVGVDIGFTEGGKLVWTVAIAMPRYPRYALAGTYAGASGDVSFFGGASANVLVGGNGVSLQPVSVGTESGFDISGGVGSLTLTPAAPPPRR